ncbi:MAG: hypothetical protein IEMM0008_0322 [bacterium]|nr:MAG: hypothetical protein IEMM0008_0322 [bacterium]
MLCLETRKTLYTSEYPASATPQWLEAMKHVEDCSECKSFLEGEKTFGTLLQKAVIKQRVPKELKERLLKPPKPYEITRRKSIQQIAIGVSALFLVILSFFFIYHKSPPDIISQIVDDHLQFKGFSGIQVQSSAPGIIKAWYKGEVDFPVHLPGLTAQLRGARCCFFNHVKEALVYYEYKKSQVSLFILHKMPEGEIKAQKTYQINGKQVQLLDIQGHTVVYWQNRGLNYFLISELSHDEILQLTRTSHI